MLGKDSCTAGPEPCVMQKGEAGANRWRGMLYGMTNRAGWTGHDPNNNRAQTMQILAQNPQSTMSPKTH